MRYLKTLIIFLIALALTVFSVSNHHVVELQLFLSSYKVAMPLFLVILISMMLGVVACGIYFTGFRLKQFRVNSKNHKKIRSLEEELEAVKYKQNLKAIN